MSDHAQLGRFDRRTWMTGMIGAGLAAAGSLDSLSVYSADAERNDRPTETEIREFLRKLLLSRKDVDLWLGRMDFPFCKYDADLGYLHVDRDFQEGLDGAICRYRYDKLDARQTIAYADKPCRINTYGDSFTSCEQVSDGETWQEALAAHLGEPIRNYGIGGYSVYQAYLRMQREEQRSPAEYIIFNIYDDDHARNVHGWQRFKFGVNRKSPNPTVPHVTVDLASGTIGEKLNPCPTRESIYDLCDLERTYALFQEDFYLHNRLLKAAKKAKGESVAASDYEDKRLMKQGIVASMRIVDLVNDYAKKNGKQILFVLSYGAYTLKLFLEKGFRFDQELVDYFHQIKLPYVDLMQAHVEDAARYKGTVEEGLKRYFIGHYNPLGNHFCAFAIKDALVKMLDPKPAAYSQ